MNYRVSCEDEGLEGAEVVANDVEEAAELAMEEWNSGGSFAGDPYPSHLVLTVVEEESQATKHVRIDVDWVPSFHACEVEDPALVPAPEDA